MHERPPNHHEQDRHQPPSLTRSAVQATLHCLTGCAIGEVLGMVLATALGWGNAASIAVSIVLAFFFGYALTIQPVLRAGIPFRRAARVAIASDTVSITTMEIVDNALIASGLPYFVDASVVVDAAPLIPGLGVKILRRLPFYEQGQWLATVSGRHHPAVVSSISHAYSG